VGESPVFDGGPLKTAGIIFLDIVTGAILSKEISDQNNHVRVLRYTMDGRYLIESGIRDTVEIWDAKHERLLQEICSQPSAGAVSSDGKYLALGGGSPLLPGGKVFVYQFR
jgi:WD40 repeat protein